MTRNLKKLCISAAMLMLLLLCLFALCACGASSESYDMSVEPQSSESVSNYSYKDAAVGMAPMTADMSMTEPEMAVTEAAAGKLAAGSTSSAAQLNADKIIWSAELRIETTEFDKAAADIERLLASFDGFIASSSINGNTRYYADGSTGIVDRYGYYVLRVPCYNFEAFLASTGNLGNVTSNSRRAVNITADFTDREARKLSLETQEQRLLELLAKAEDINAIITIESKLADVRYNIESIESQLRNWQAQVDYSTVTVNLQEVAKYTPSAAVKRSFGERLAAAVSGSWDNFKDGIQDFAVELIYVLPTLLILAAVIVVIVLIVRRIVRGRRGGKQKIKTPEVKADLSDAEKQDE